MPAWNTDVQRAVTRCSARDRVMAVYFQIHHSTTIIIIIIIIIITIITICIDAQP
jgi:hypothetical protein